MSEEKPEAILRNGKVVISSSEQAKSLHDNGYGTLDESKENLTLSSVEALYLLEEKRIRIIEEASGQTISLSQLVDEFKASDEIVWTKYLIYQDLRRRGYVVRDGFGYGVDFRVYERGGFGDQAAKYIAYGILEGTPTPIETIREVLRFAQNMKRELILAVVDRRGEVVYYSISQLTF
jgi:tRNA-intron endonuclease